MDWVPGEALHGHLLTHGDPVSATVPGTLMSLGWYPGLVLEPPLLDGSADLASSVLAGEARLRPGMVHGEVHRLRDPAEALARLDEIEAFRGFDATDNLYERRLIETVAGLAWIYVLAHDPERGVPIPSGDWRVRD